MIPASFQRDGFITPKTRRRVMIGTDGPSDSGKTEFAASAPGPAIHLCLDRGHEGMLDNPNPPPSRQPDHVYLPITIPPATSETQEGYLPYWRAFYNAYVKALANPDARCVVLDGDSDSWELQRLVEFGKLQQVPPHLYSGVNAARRAMIAKAYDSGKIVIATNKLKREYQPQIDSAGKQVLDNAGKPVREWDGKSWERQGFPDQDYLWQIQLRHLYDETKQRWGVKITKCKPQPDLVGEELWGSDCTFASLVQYVYPHVALKDWGF